MMEYTISISFTGKLIHAVIDGQNSKDNVNRYMSDIQQEVEKLQCKNILIEDQLTGPGLDPIDVFDIIRSHTRYARIHKLRIGYIDINRYLHRTTVAFGENLANIFGVNVKVFNSVEDATAWLITVEHEPEF
ncbi:MAG: hypothetical protein WCX28_14835 [Bacteriovoracaceae bacterium]|nr:hypothetical protein [Bacteroidota bacterium]